MEWVEVTGRTVEEAKDRALDRLGVDERDAEFEVIEEPRAGFFGRVKGEARVRARVKPTLRAKPESGDRRNRRGGRGRTRAAGEGESTGGRAPGSAATKVKPRSAPAASAGVDDDGPAAAGDDVDDDGGADRGPGSGNGRRRGGRGRSGRPAGRPAGFDDVQREGGSSVPLETQVEMTEEFAKGLVQAFGFAAETSTEIAEDHESAEVRIEGGELGLLIGPKGRTLAAINEISRAVVLRQLDAAPEGRVHVDISGYRQRRREALERFARSVAEEVVSSGRPKALEPMSAADRKTVHDAVAEIDGVRTSSEGEEPSRRVVISPEG
jgi:spoIIIJ-associated protein